MTKFTRNLMAASVLFTALSLAPAHAGCKSIVTVTGTAVGATIGVLIDTFTFFLTAGSGTIISTTAGTAGGALAGEYVCPDDNPGPAVSIRLDQVIRECADRYHLFYQPIFFIGNSNDFCTLPPNSLIRGADVANNSGYQLDAIDVIGQLQVLLDQGAELYAQRAAQHGPLESETANLFRGMANDLNECRRTYEDRASLKHEDVCFIRPSAETASIWKRAAGRKAKFELSRVLRTVWRQLPKTA